MQAFSRQRQRARPPTSGTSVSAQRLSAAISFTTNLGYDEWPNFLGNRPMVEALLSRLRHYCHTVNIKGPSLCDLQV
jgi:DNA replication protein DnaC